MRRFFFWLPAVLVLIFSFPVLLPGCGRDPGDRYYRQALQELSDDNPVPARALLEKSIERRPGHPDNSSAYNYLGIACRNIGMTREAIEAFEEAHRLDPAFAAPIYNLAVIRAHAGDLQSAADMFNDAALLDRRDTAALKYLAALEYRRGRYREAAAALQRALDRRPRDAGLATALALAEAPLTGPRDTLRQLREVLSMEPLYPPALFNAGWLAARRLQQPALAADYLEKFLDVADNPEMIARARNLLQLPPDEESAPAEVRERRRPVTDPSPDAERRPLEAARHAIDELGNETLALNHYLAAAAHAGRDGQPERRREILREAVQRCPGQARAHYAYGLALLESDDYVQALAALKQAAALAPGWMEAHKAVGRAAVESGEYDAAAVAFNRALQLDETDADSAWELAELYDLRLQMNRRARESWEMFLRRFPDDPRSLEARRRLRELEAAVDREGTPASGERVSAGEQPAASLNLDTGGRRNTSAAIQAFNRGTMYQEREEWDRAVHFYRQALQNDDRLVEAYYNLGAVYRMNGDLPLALECYRRVLSLDPERVQARYNMALVSWEMRRYEDAEQLALQALESRPDAARPHYLLGIIYGRDDSRRESAAHHYRRFLELAPDDPAAPAVRRWLSRN